MTFKEKLEQEFPNCVSIKYAGGCAGCPSGYGYEPSRACNKNSDPECAECWNRGMPDIGIPAAETTEAVNHPPHYNTTSIECWDALDAMVSSFTDPVAAALTWQVGKYIWRHPHKGKPVEDLKKARDYLDRLIEREAANEQTTL